MQTRGYGYAAAAEADGICAKKSMSPPMVGGHKNVIIISMSWTTKWACLSGQTLLYKLELVFVKPYAPNCLTNTV